MQASCFHLSGYEFDTSTRSIRLHYALDNTIAFTETFILPASCTGTPTDASLQALHLAAGISYFKTYVPKEIVIDSYEIDEKQAAFWKSVYENGLGEFCFKNEIDGLDVQFPFSKSYKLKAKSSSDKRNESANTKRVLVPIGGGKDSLVTIDLLKKAGHDITLFRVGQHPIIDRQAEIAGLPLMNIERHLSDNLFELNEQGALNGHVPITAILSCLAIVIAEMEGFDAVVWSNESSANYGNTVVDGKEINHQWSKSLEFETAFQEYIQSYISQDIDSFSLLRPLSELTIGKHMASLSQFFEVFTSCNANWRIMREKPENRWDPSDPKTVFVFCMMAAFVDEHGLQTIFGMNIFDDLNSLPLIKQLLGTEGIKPFECVGTPEETKAALLLVHEKGLFNDSPALQYFETEVLPTIEDGDGLIESVLKPSNDHCIPESFSH